MKTEGDHVVHDRPVPAPAPDQGAAGDLDPGLGAAGARGVGAGGALGRGRRVPNLHLGLNPVQSPMIASQNHDPVPSLREWARSPGRDLSTNVTTPWTGLVVKRSPSLGAAP